MSIAEQFGSVEIKCMILLIGNYLEEKREMN